MTLHTLRLYCPDVCLKNCFSSKICPFFTSHLSYLLDFHLKSKEKLVPLYFCFGCRKKTNELQNGYILAHPLILTLSFSLILSLSLSLSLSFPFLSRAQLHPFIPPSVFYSPFPLHFTLHLTLQPHAKKRKNLALQSKFSLCTHTLDWQV